MNIFLGYAHVTDIVSVLTTMVTNAVSTLLYHRLPAPPATLASHIATSDSNTRASMVEREANTRRRCWVASQTQ
jgi:hypothetical protein